MDTIAAAIEATWSSFESLDVTKWNWASGAYDIPMYYYYDGNCATLSPHTVQRLFTPYDPPTGGVVYQGDCECWADLLRHCLLAHGITSAYKVIVLPPIGLSEFCVRNSALTDPVDSTWYEYCQRPGGIPGQNSSCRPIPTPPDSGPGQPAQFQFSQHVIVRVGRWSDRFLDPSYGVTTTDPLDYTEKAVDAYMHGHYRWSLQGPGDHVRFDTLEDGW